MLVTLFKALETDFRNVDNNRYVRSEANISQNLSRILSIRKHYPEFKAQKPLMFPKLAELSKLSKKEGLCLTYWHDCGEITEFNAALSGKTRVSEDAILARRPSKFKTASLSRFLERNEDQVLMAYLSDLSRTRGSNEQKRVFNTQAHRQQVAGLLYHLHVLENQLQTMMARHTENKLDFSPERNVVAQEFVLPIAFDNRPDQLHPMPRKLTIARSRKTIEAKNQEATSSNFDTNGPIDIWYSLAEDANTPYRFLVWLSENSNPYISQRAQATLKKQQALQTRATSASTAPVYQSVSAAVAS